MQPITHQTRTHCTPFDACSAPRLINTGEFGKNSRWCSLRKALRHDGLKCMLGTRSIKGCHIVDPISSIYLQDLQARQYACLHLLQVQTPSQLPALQALARPLQLLHLVMHLPQAELGRPCLLLWARQGGICLQHWNTLLAICCNHCLLQHSDSCGSLLNAVSMLGWYAT